MWKKFKPIESFRSYSASTLKKFKLRTHQVSVIMLTDGTTFVLILCFCKFFQIVFTLRLYICWIKISLWLLFIPEFETKTLNSSGQTFYMMRGIIVCCIRPSATTIHLAKWLSLSFCVCSGHSAVEVILIYSRLISKCTASDLLLKVLLDKKKN